MEKSIISRCGITFITIFCLISLAITGCSSDNKKDEESEAAQEATDSATSADAQIEESSGDTSAEAALDQEAQPTDPATAGATTEVDLAGGTDAAAPSAEAQAAAEETAPPAEPAAIAESSEANGSNNADLFGTGSSTPVSKASAPRKAGPLQHIKDAPFERGGMLLNTVYLARQGDTLKSVSQKLFSEDKSKDLKKANPSLKNNLKVGEKVYFNSPARTEDHDKMMVVYEDQGLPATVYVSKEGDTLKSLSKEWFGSEDNWKELYSVNRGIASTKDLPAGTEIRYWPATVSLMAYTVKQGAPTEVAATDVPKEPSMDDFSQAPPPPAAGTMNEPPPPPTDMAQNNQPPPPVPPEQMAPPPPPPVEAKPVVKKAGKGMEDGDRDLLFAGAIGAACLILGGLVYHRRRARKMNVTQV